MNLQFIKIEATVIGFHPLYPRAWHLPKITQAKSTAVPACEAGHRDAARRIQGPLGSSGVPGGGGSENRS